MILAQHLHQSSPWLSEFSRLFDTAVRRFDTASTPVRVLEDDLGWTLQLDLPGTSKEDAGLEIKEGSLELKVKGSAVYQLSLGKQVDAQAIHAKLDLGVLSIRLPKADSKNEPKQIEIL